MKKKQGLSILLFLILTLSFQNCARVNFSDASLEFPKVSQNGGVYGGKPSGTYYRFVPDFTCEQRESPSAILEVNDSAVTLTENKKLLCGALKQQMDISKIDSSVFQNQIIGYLEGIFEGGSDLPTKIPSNLVEVWCKDRNDEQGIETILHFDRSQNLAVNRIYYADTISSGSFQTELIPDFPVARVISQSSVIVKDGKGFELTVHRDQPASQVGLFKAELQASIAGQQVSRQTSCRLGGSLDPSIWPSQQIVDFNVLSFKTSPDMSTFAYSAKTANGVANLFAANADGTSQKQVAPDMLSPGILDFNISPDSKNIVYRGSQRNQDVGELFKVGLDGTGASKIGEDLVVPEQTTTSLSFLPSLKFTNDGSAVVYSDGAQDTNPGGTHPRLKIVSINGGTPVLLGPALPSFVGAYGYNISAQLKKVVFLQGSPSTPDLYSVNFDGSGLLKITPVTENSINWYDDLQLSQAGSFVILKTFGASGIRDYAVALDGSRTVAVPANWSWSSSNATDSYALLGSKMIEKTPGNFVSDSSQIGVLNLSTGGLQILPGLADPFFSKDSSLLFGAEASGDGRQQAAQFSLTSGDQAELCPGVSGSVLKIHEIEQGRFLIVAYETGSLILNIYLTNSAGACAKVNSAVTVGTSQLNQILEVAVSPDHQKILVHMNVKTVSASNGTTENGSQLLYIPLNGRAPRVVNSPTYDTAVISQVGFLADSRTVLYMGEQLRPGEKNIFLWKAPINQ